MRQNVRSKNGGRRKAPKFRAGAGEEDATGTGTWLGKLLATFWPKSYKWRPKGEASDRRQINHSETKQFPALVKIPNPQEQKL